MRSAFKIMLVSLALTGLTGCGIAGQWTLHDIEPESAEGAFKTADLTLNKDGTYEMTATYAADRSMESKGDWTYEDDTLTFTTADGGKRNYPAQLNLFHDRLKLTHTIDGADVIAVMKRD